MKILFCCEGFLIDGVTSYNLYMSAALQAAGHRVAVAGRWTVPNGFQRRHEEAGVTVLQSFSPLLKDPIFISQCAGFNPDIIISDARRSFPLALAIKKRTGAKVITVFHDYPQLERAGKRSMEALMSGSEVWLTSEKNIHSKLINLTGAPPSFFIQRPITSAITHQGAPQKDPFRVLCLGRLSRWKIPGLRYIVENGCALKRAIPSLEIIVVGGGRRIINFWIAAKKANYQAGSPFIHIVGTQIDPNPWFKKASLVCAGATSATEAILSNRPVIAMSGIWLGLVTPDNIDYAIKSHFGERRETIDPEHSSSNIDLNKNPEIVGRTLIDMYSNWDDHAISRQVSSLNGILRNHYNTDIITAQFDEMLAEFDDIVDDVVNIPSI